jgi:hypothetical protein
MLSGENITCLLILNQPFNQLLETLCIAALCQLVYVIIDTIDTNSKLKVLAINYRYVVSSKKVSENVARAKIAQITKQDQY